MIYRKIIAKAVFIIVISLPQLLLAQEVNHSHWVGLLPANFFELAAKEEKSLTWVIPLHKNRSKESDRIGNLNVRFDPKAAGDMVSTTLTTKLLPDAVVEPHVYDHDLGYGPYYHITALERFIGWVKIMPTSELGVVWGDFASAFGVKNVSFLYLGSGELLEWVNNEGQVESIVIENADEHALVVRPEQPMDMSCGDDAARYEPYQTKLIPKSEWVDENGRSRFDVYYTRGC